MVATFLIVSNMKPYDWPRQFDIRSTDDKLVVALDVDVNAGKTRDELTLLLRETGASEVNEKTFE
jgi:hypothetical protein